VSEKGPLNGVYVCVCCCGVGALFDNGDNELRSAFSYEMISQNKRAARFRLSSETHRVDNDDSYAVGAASTPRLLSQVASNGVGRVDKVRGGTRVQGVPELHAFKNIFSVTVTIRTIVTIVLSCFIV